MNSGNLRPTHAYVIVWFRGGNDNQEVFVLNGHESAVHPGAITELRRKLSDRVTAEKFYGVIQGNGGRNEAIFMNSCARWDCGIKRNLSGVLLIGRSALPGGRLQPGEGAKEGVMRELTEQFLLPSIESFYFQHVLTRVVDKGRCEVYYSLDLANFCPPALSAHQFALDNVEFFAKHRTASTEKRFLEIVPLANMPKLLTAPDKRDQLYLISQMSWLAQNICEHLKTYSGEGLVEREAEQVLAMQLLSFQLLRESNHVEAVETFMKAPFI